MEYKLIINGRLPGLNEYINASRTNPYLGNKMKKDSEAIVIDTARIQLKRLHIEKPVYFSYSWYEPNRMRDKDNISSMGRKVIQDALVNCKVIKKDGWKEISGFDDKFYCDKKNPRIEVLIVEQE